MAGGSGRSPSKGPPGARRRTKKLNVTAIHRTGIVDRRRRSAYRIMGFGGPFRQYRKGPCPLLLDAQPAGAVDILHIVLEALDLRRDDALRDIIIDRNCRAVVERD